MKLDKLITKYPSFFYPKFYFECGVGWYDILEDFFKMLTNQKLKVKMSQIKEKYGALRIYIEGTTNTAEYNILKELVNETELKSIETCEFCGKKGKIRNDNGWYRCRCKHCAIVQKLEASII